MDVYASEVVINKGNPNLQAELTKLEGMLGKEGLTTFRALCRDANTPISVETLEQFRNRKGNAYEYATAIRNSYAYIDAFLKEQEL